MPWKEMSVMSQRREFVELAQAEGTNKRAFAVASGSALRLDTSGLGVSVKGARSRPGRAAAAASLLACTYPIAG